MKNVVKKLLAVILSAALVLSLAACGPKIDPPETVVNNALTAFKASDFETAAKYFNEDPKTAINDAENEEDTALADEFTATILGSLEWEIVSSEENGDTAAVKTKIKSVDMSLVISDYISQAFAYIFSDLSEEELDSKYSEILLNSIKNHTDDLKETEVDIKLNKADGGWIINMDDELVDAILGGMLTAFSGFEDDTTSEEDTELESEITTSAGSESANTSSTLGEKNALAQAGNYLSFTSFSYSGLIEQLEFEGFTPDEAKYAADNCGADWNEQAALKAQEYLDYSSFSRSGLIEQLEFEGFTTEQAEYGVTAVGY